MSVGEITAEANLSVGAQKYCVKSDGETPMVNTCFCSMCIICSQWNVAQEDQNTQTQN